MSPHHDEDVQVEVAVAAQLATRIAQEHTMHSLRRTAGLTAVVLLLLSAITLGYVARTAIDARDTSRGNRLLLAEFRAAEEQETRQRVEAARRSEQRVARAIRVLEQRTDRTDQRVTQQLQVILDELAAQHGRPRIVLPRPSPARP